MARLSNEKQNEARVCAREDRDRAYHSTYDKTRQHLSIPSPYLVNTSVHYAVCLKLPQLSIDERQAKQFGEIENVGGQDREDDLRG
jgi:hypothetical protein